MLFICGRYSLHLSTLILATPALQPEQERMAIGALVDKLVYVDLAFSWCSHRQEGRKKERKKDQA